MENSTGDRYCASCGRMIYPQELTINNICRGCLSLTNTTYPGLITRFNYKCPDCYGEFQYPTTDTSPSTHSITFHGNPRCPFCGRSMEGLK